MKNLIMLLLGVSISLSTMALDEDARPLELGQFYDNTKIQGWDTHAWIFIAPSDGVYRFKLTDTRSDLGFWVMLSESEGHECDDVDGGRGDEICEIQLSAGTYKVYVEEYEAQDSRYDFQVEKL